MARKYSSVSTETTLASGISNSATTMTVATNTGSALLGGVTLGASNVDQFTVAIDPDTASEEIVFITGVTSDTLTITRGQAGTSAITHSGGAKVKHVLTSDDLNYFNTGIDGAVAKSTVTTKGDLIAATGSAAVTRLAAGTNGYFLKTNSATATGLEWAAITANVTTDDTQTLTNKTIALGSNTVSGTTAQFNTALTDGDFATLAGTETLTNKTLTAPVISTISNTGTLTLPTSTDTLVGKDTTDTFTNKTFKSPQEITTVSATAATGTINFDAVTQGILYYTSNASANWTLNIRGNSSTTLSSLMDVGDSITVVFMVTNGVTAYRQTAFQIDGSSVTPKWQGGSAPSAGNASSIDVYTVTIIKTAATPTYTAFESQARFAQED